MQRLPSFLQFAIDNGAKMCYTMPWWGRSARNCIPRCNSVGRVPALGAGCRTFESCHFDHKSPKPLMQSVSDFYFFLTEKPCKSTSSGNRGFKSTSLLPELFCFPGEIIHFYDSPMPLARNNFCKIPYLRFRFQCTQRINSLHRCFYLPHRKYGTAHPPLSFNIYCKEPHFQTWLRKER